MAQAASGGGRTHRIGSVTADGAYDEVPTYNAAAARGEDITVVIAPPVMAVLGDHAELNPSQRDRHIAMIQAQGRLGWQKETGYGRRSVAETTMGATRPSSVRACAPVAWWASAPKSPMAWPCSTAC